MRIVITSNLRAACAAILAGLALAAGLSGCAAPAPARPIVYAPPLREESVRIPSSDAALTGQLFTPGGHATVAGRRPAVVLLHGCGGMFGTSGKLAARHRDWAERFANWGFVALLLDSFSPRGLGPICDMKERPIHPWKERTADAYAALDYLAARRDVDAGAVLVMGWSNGGSTVMGVIRPQVPGRSPAGAQFKAAIAFYPGCSLPLQQKGWRASMPTLILHGEADDWTPAAPCVALANKLNGTQPALQTIVYPGAHHGFDQPVGAVQFRPNVYNPAAPGQRGAHTGQDPAARLASIDEVRRFVQQALK